MPYFIAHLHTVYFTGLVPVVLCPYTEVERVNLFLGNDLAGKELFPLPVVIDTLVPSEQSDHSYSTPKTRVYPACVVTQSQKADSVNETFMVDPELVAARAVKPECESGGDKSDASKVVDLTLCNPGVPAETPLQLGRVEQVMSQRADPSLAKCFAAVGPEEELLSVPFGFNMEGGVLMWKWAAFPDRSDWSATY